MDVRDRSGGAYLVGGLDLPDVLVGEADVTAEPQVGELPGPNAAHDPLAGDVEALGEVVGAVVGHEATS